MANLKMRVDSPIEVSRVDVEIEVRRVSDDELLGHLRISKGSLDWWPKNAKKPIRKRWGQFARLMES